MGASVGPSPMKGRYWHSNIWPSRRVKVTDCFNSNTDEAPPLANHQHAGRIRQLNGPDPVGFNLKPTAVWDKVRYARIASPTSFFHD